MRNYSACGQAGWGAGAKGRVSAARIVAKTACPRLRAVSATVRRMA
jgi:hypothetical protein